jgi:AAA15 family ATPase/GTPase
MSEQHIKDLEICNFKCFKHLNIANIRQVNLIGGKNNVGKTAFLEALELFASSNKASDLFISVYRVLRRRQDINQSRYFEMDFIYDDESETSISSLSKFCSLKRSVGNVGNIDIFKDESDTLPTEILTALVNNNEEKVPIEYINRSDRFIQQRRASKNNLIYISASKIQEQDIAISFGILTELFMEDFLNESLSFFDKNIIELKQISKERGIVLKLKLQNKKSLVLLSSLGEGINRYIAILCAIWASKDSVLLIDEIENGIHYTNYKKLWQIIFKASVDANCQIFITTHSKECITAFNDVQFEDENCNTQYFEFYKNLKTDLITATARDKEQLRYALTHEGRIRGE